ncbi:MAG: Gfo/Idh/MocA family oxidoreductase, partial [Planctomycetota bacterium]
ANRGGQLVDAFQSHDDCRITAICDVNLMAMKKMVQRVGNGVRLYSDFRQLIYSSDVDAVVIATPDHWHALQTVIACYADKDVYVEKPLSVTVVEGRAMVDAARRNKRIVQVGTHRRSSPLYRELAPRIQDGLLGHVCMSRCYRISNMAPSGIGKLTPVDPPSHLDWEMWLGPRAFQPYQSNIAPYKFRWWQNYSSQMGNWGVHYLDAIRWCTGDLAPSSVCAMGGRFAVADDRTIPDTMEVTFQFDSGRMVTFGQYETSGAAAIDGGEVEMRGTLGTALVNESSYEIRPERGGQFQERQPRMKPETKELGTRNAALTALHARNFLDCVRSRKTPNADVEIGHRSTTMSLIANISHAVGRRLQWDASTEQFVNDAEANEMLHYEYRDPWKGILETPE